MKELMNESLTPAQSTAITRSKIKTAEDFEPSRFAPCAILERDPPGGSIAAC
jgi:hypothetical protein